MFIGYFTERPYQDPESGYFGATGKPIMDLTVSNEITMLNSAPGCTIGILTKRSTPKRWALTA